MKLAISGGDDVYRNVSVRVLLDDARRHGVNWIELWHPNNTTVEGLDGTLALIAGAGIGVAAVSSYSHLVLPKNMADERPTVQECIDIAGKVSAPFVNTYWGRSEARDDDRLMRLYAQRLAPCLEQAAKQGVTLVLENECDVANEDPALSDITRRPESIRALMDLVQSPHFGANFDATNFYIAGVEPFPYAYDIIAGHIRYVHIKDGATYHHAGWVGEVRSFTEHVGQYMCVPLGEGAINHEALLARLKADGYDGFLTLEPHVPPSRLQEVYATALQYLRVRGYGA